MQRDGDRESGLKGSHSLKAGHASLQLSRCSALALVFALFAASPAKAEAGDAAQAAAIAELKAAVDATSYRYRQKDMAAGIGPLGWQNRLRLNFIVGF